MMIAPSFEFLSVDEKILRAVEDDSIPSYVWDLLMQFLQERETVVSAKVQASKVAQMHKEAVQFRDEATNVSDLPTTPRRQHSPVLSLKSQKYNTIDPFNIIVNAIEQKQEAADANLRKQMDSYQALQQFCDDRMQYLSKAINDATEEQRKLDNDKIVDILYNNLETVSRNESQQATLETRLKLWMKLKQDLNALDK